MIVRTAIELNGKVYVGELHQRHDDVYLSMINDHKVPTQAMNKCIMGFIDDKGVFLNRQDAAKQAFACGQLPHDKTCPEIIVSEDLW